MYHQRLWNQATRVQLNDTRWVIFLNPFLTDDLIDFTKSSPVSSCPHSYLARFVLIYKCHIACKTTLLRRIKYGSCLKWLSLKLFDWICRVKFTNVYSQTKETRSAKLPATQESCTIFCSCPACQSFYWMAEHRFSRATKTSFKPSSMARK